MNFTIPAYELHYRNHNIKNSTLKALPNLNLSSLTRAHELMAEFAYERYLSIQNTHPAITTLTIKHRSASIKVGNKIVIEMEIITC